MKHDPISVIITDIIIISTLAFTFDSPNLLVFSLKDLWKFDAEVEIFTLVSVLFIPCSAVYPLVFLNLISLK